MEVEEKENQSPQPFRSCPLPSNTCSAAGRSQETETGTAGREYNYIPEAYGQQVISAAKVTKKHLGRLVVARDLDSSSASSLEMSVLETKVVRKFATPLPRGGNV